MQKKNIIFAVKTCVKKRKVCSSSTKNDNKWHQVFKKFLEKKTIRIFSNSQLYYSFFNFANFSSSAFKVSLSFSTSSFGALAT